MMWHDCSKKVPQKRHDNSMYSEPVLVYDGMYHSIAYYDFHRKEWKDITVNAYIPDMKGQWKYPGKPRKKLKIHLE